VLLIACIIYGAVTYNQRKGSYRLPAMIAAMFKKAGNKGGSRGGAGADDQQVVGSSPSGLLPTGYLSSAQASPRRGFPSDGSRTASGEHFTTVNISGPMGSGRLGSGQLPVSMGGAPRPGRAASGGSAGYYGSGEVEEGAVAGTRGTRGVVYSPYQVPSGNSPTARGPGGSPRHVSRGSSRSPHF
jgi:hypothetical protein